MKRDGLIITDNDGIELFSVAPFKREINGMLTIDYVFTACNSHEALVEALESIVDLRDNSILEEAAYSGGGLPKKWINDRGHYNDGYNAALKIVRDRAKAALARVREEEK